MRGGNERGIDSRDSWKDSERLLEAGTGQAQSHLLAREAGVGLDSCSERAQQLRQRCFSSFERPINERGTLRRSAERWRSASSCCSAVCTAACAIAASAASRSSFAVSWSALRPAHSVRQLAAVGCGSLCPGECARRRRCCFEPTRPARGCLVGCAARALEGRAAWRPPRPAACERAQPSVQRHAHRGAFQRRSAPRLVKLQHRQKLEQTGDRRQGYARQGCPLRQAGAQTLPCSHLCRLRSQRFGLSDKRIRMGQITRFDTAAHVIGYLLQRSHLGVRQVGLGLLRGMPQAASRTNPAKCRRPA